MTPSEPDRRREPSPSAEEPPSEDRGARSPKPYSPPRLVVYGRLTEVTRFGGSQVIDSGNNLGNLQ